MASLLYFAAVPGWSEPCISERVRNLYGGTCAVSDAVGGHAKGRLPSEAGPSRSRSINGSESPTDQKAVTPFGVPRPDGPSQPTRALHHWGVGHVPLDPEMTSKRDEVWLYGRAFGYPVVLPDSA